MYRLTTLFIVASVSATCLGSMMGGASSASLMAARDGMGSMGYGLGGMGAASMGARDAGMDIAYGRGMGDFGFGGMGMGMGMGMGSPYGSRFDLGGYGPFGAGAGSYLSGRDALGMGSMSSLGALMAAREGAYSPASAAAMTASRDSVTVSNPLGASVYGY